MKASFLVKDISWYIAICAPYMAAMVQLQKVSLKLCCKLLSGEHNYYGPNYLPLVIASLAGIVVLIIHLGQNLTTL